MQCIIVIITVVPCFPVARTLFILRIPRPPSLPRVEKRRVSDRLDFIARTDEARRAARVADINDIVIIIQRVVVPVAKVAAVTVAAAAIARNPNQINSSVGSRARRLRRRFRLIPRVYKV